MAKNKRGDSFLNQSSLAKGPQQTSFIPNEQTWSARIEGLLRGLLGIDLPDASQRPIKIRSSALGEVDSKPVDLSAPLTNWSVIGTLKAYAALLLSYSNSLTSVLNQLVIANTELGLIKQEVIVANAELNQVNDRLAATETQLAASNQQLGLMRLQIDGVNQELNAITEELESLNSRQIRLSDNLFGSTTMNEVYGTDSFDIPVGTIAFSVLNYGVNPTADVDGNLINDGYQTWEINSQTRQPWERGEGWAADYTTTALDQVITVDPNPGSSSDLQTFRIVYWTRS